MAALTVARISHELKDQDERHAARLQQGLEQEPLSFLRGCLAAGMLPSDITLRCA